MHRSSILVATLLASVLTSCSESPSGNQGGGSAEQRAERYVDGSVHLLLLNRLQGAADGVPCTGEPPVLAASSELRNDQREAGDQSYLFCVGDTLASAKFTPTNKIDRVATEAQRDILFEQMGHAAVDAFVPGAVDMGFGGSTLLAGAAATDVRLIITNAEDATGQGRVQKSWLPEPSDENGVRVAFLGASPTRAVDADRKMFSLGDDELVFSSVTDSVAAEAKRVRAEHDVDFVIVLSAVAGSTNSRMMDIDEVDLVVGSRDAASEVRDIAFRSGSGLVLAAPFGEEVGHTTISIVDNDLQISDVSERHKLADKIAREEIWLARFTERYRTNDADELIAAVASNPAIDNEAFVTRLRSLEEDREGIVVMNEFAGSLIDHRVADLPEVAHDHAAVAVKGDFRRRFDAAVAAGNFPPPERLLEHPRVPTADECFECHQEQYAFWLNTPHATAFESVEELELQGDPSCHECHSSGFSVVGGYDDVRLGDAYTGVSCYSCHPGASTSHANNARRAMEPLYTWSIKNEQKCGQCHSQRRSPEFEQPALVDQVACPPMDLMSPQLVATRLEALEIIEQRVAQGIANDADRFFAARARLGKGISSAVGELEALAEENLANATVVVQVGRLLDRYGRSKAGQGVLRSYLAKRSGEESVNTAYVDMLLFPRNEDAADPGTALTRLKFLIPEDLGDSATKYVTLRCYMVDALYMTGAKRRGESLLLDLISTQGRDARIRERVLRWDVDPKLLEGANAAAEEAAEKAKTAVPGQ